MKSYKCLNPGPRPGQIWKLSERAHPHNIIYVQLTGDNEGRWKVFEEDTFTQLTYTFSTEVWEYLERL